jgi:hypothetical protein
VNDARVRYVQNKPDDSIVKVRWLLDFDCYMYGFASLGYDIDKQHLLLVIANNAT